MVSVTAHIEQAHYATQITSGTNVLIADERTDAGGTEKGFSPSELLASSLAACTAITCRMYADRKEWDLKKAKIQVRFETIDGIALFTRTINYSGSLTDEQKARLTQIANNCPVHKILSHTIQIKTIEI